MGCDTRGCARLIRGLGRLWEGEWGDAFLGVIWGWVLVFFVVFDECFFYEGRGREGV